MIWSARAHGLQTDLITINGNVNTGCIINDIFKKSNVIQLANSEYGELKWIFQKDGACPHTSKKKLKLTQTVDVMFWTLDPQFPGFKPN
ncbi:hypothetical protein M0813_08918 [Anaeramoeba flamelloides]|uniref:Transposase n=1 Tax=Anaeramoeba flamelloides TaxID=1746091 RepID=A0ABQ8X9U2_9EUKA|nr:hypothetical protein M0813_08918 [Anaeramoeba flamelloides]